MIMPSPPFVFFSFPTHLHHARTVSAPLEEKKIPFVKKKKPRTHDARYSTLNEAYKRKKNRYQPLRTSATTSITIAAIIRQRQSSAGTSRSRGDSHVSLLEASQCCHHLARNDTFLLSLHSGCVSGLPSHRSVRAFSRTPSRVDRIGSPGIPDLLGDFIPPQTEGPFDPSLFRGVVIFPFDLGNKLGREGMTNSSSSLFLDSAFVAGLGHGVGIGGGPADVEDFVVVKGLVGHCFFRELAVCFIAIGYKADTTGVEDSD